MIIDRNANLSDLRQAASLEAWHTDQTLEKGGILPFQRLYFLLELADACNDIGAELVKTHGLADMLAEVRRPPVTYLPPVAPKPKRTRKPKTKHDPS